MDETKRYKNTESEVMQPNVDNVTGKLLTTRLFDGNILCDRSFIRSFLFYN